MLMSSFLEISTKCSRLIDNKITIIIPNSKDSFNLLNSTINCNIQLKVITNNNSKYNNDLLVYSKKSPVDHNILLKFIYNVQSTIHVKNIIDPLIFLFIYYPFVCVLSKLSGNLDRPIYSIDGYAVKTISKKQNKIISKGDRIIKLHDRVDKILNLNIIPMHGVHTYKQFYKNKTVIIKNIIDDNPYLWLERFENHIGFIPTRMLDVKFKTYSEKNHYKNKGMTDNFIKIDNVDNNCYDRIEDIVLELTDFVGHNNINEFNYCINHLNSEYSKLCNNKMGIGFSLFILKNDNSLKCVVSDITHSMDTELMKKNINKFNDFWT